jgi:hypothetical protein
MLDRDDPATIQAATRLIESTDREGALQALWAGIPILDARLTVAVIEIVRDVVYGVTWGEHLDPDRRARDAIAAGHGLPTATRVAAMAQELHRRNGGEDPLAEILHHTDTTEIVTQLYAIADRMAVHGEFVVPSRPNLLTRQEELFDIPEPGAVVPGTDEPGTREPGAAVTGDTSPANPPETPADPAPSMSAPREGSEHDPIMVDGTAGEPNPGNSPPSAPVVPGPETSAHEMSAIGDANDAPGDPINGGATDTVGDGVRPAESGEAPGDLVPLPAGEVLVTLARGPMFPGVLDELEPLVTIDDEVPQDLFGQVRHPDVRVYFRRSVAEWIGIYFEAKFGGNQIHYEWRDDVLAIYDDPWDEDPDEQPRLIHPDSEGRYLIRQPWLALTATQTAALAQHTDALAILAGNDPVYESEAMARYLSDRPGRDIHDSVLEVVRERLENAGDGGTDDGVSDEVADHTRTSESESEMEHPTGTREPSSVGQQPPEASTTTQAHERRRVTTAPPDTEASMPDGPPRDTASEFAEPETSASGQRTERPDALTREPSAAADPESAPETTTSATAPATTPPSPSAPLSPPASSSTVAAPSRSVEVLRDRLSASRVGWPSRLDAFLRAADPFTAQDLLREIVRTTDDDPHTQVLVAMAWRAHHGQVTAAEVGAFADRLIQSDPSTVGHTVGRTIRDPRTRQHRPIHAIRADIEGRLFLHGTVADSTTTLTTPVDPDAWLNPIGHEVLPAAEAFPLLQRRNELSELAAAYGYTVHDQPDTVLVHHDEQRILIGADSLAELVNQLTDLTQQIVALRGPTPTSTDAASIPAVDVLPAPVPPAAPSAEASEAQSPAPRPRRSSSGPGTAPRPQGQSPARDAIDGITLVSVDDPSSEPLADQLAMRRHRGALLLDEPARLALTYVHRILRGPAEDAADLADTVHNVGRHGEAEQVAARLTKLAHKIDAAQFTTPITGGAIPLTDHLRAIADHVHARLTPGDTTPPTPGASAARPTDTASSATTADGRVSAGQDNADEPGKAAKQSADGAPHAPAARQPTATGHDVRPSQDPHLGTAATARGEDRNALTDTTTRETAREETGKDSVPVERPTTGREHDRPAALGVLFSGPPVTNGSPATVTSARTDSVPGRMPTTSPAGDISWPTVDLDLPQPRPPADEPPRESAREPGRDQPADRTPAPDEPASVSDTTQLDRNDGTVDGMADGSVPVGPGQNSATVQWVRLVDHASHAGYAVVTAYDAPSAVDEDNRVIRVDGNQDPLARVVDLAHKIGLIDATTGATVDAAHGQIQAATAGPRLAPHPPTQQPPATRGPAANPPERRRVAAIPAAQPPQPLPPSMTPVFDVLVRELGWTPATPDSGDSQQRAVAFRPAEPRPVPPSPTPVFDQLMHELGWQHHLTTTHSDKPPVDPVGTPVNRPPTPTHNATANTTLNGTPNGRPDGHRPSATPARARAHDEPATTAGMAPGHRAHLAGGWGLETAGTRGRNGR